MSKWASDVARSATRILSLGVLGGYLAIASGCATMYVDNGLKDVAAADYRHPQTPQAVQLLFTFETKGTPNARATVQLKKEVNDTVVGSGIFATVSGDPVPGGALLNIIINNIPVTDDAFAKGFATGLTFGLAGNVVTDGYVCTLDYQAHPGAAKLNTTARHAIHTTVGAKGAPPNSTKAPDARTAAATMTRQIVSNALKDLAANPEFGQ